MPIRTTAYSLTRSELMLITARYYAQTFWWFIAITPTFGLIALIFGSGILKMIGLMAMLWPFSIPARSIITSTKSSRLFCNGCTLEVFDNELVFLGEKAEPKRLRFKLPFDEIRSVKDRGEFLLLQSRYFGIVPIRNSAFSSESDKAKTIEMIEAAVTKRYAD